MKQDLLSLGWWTHDRGQQTQIYDHQRSEEKNFKERGASGGNIQEGALKGSGVQWDEADRA